MPANMTIDQTGLPAAIAGRARTDGLDTGATVTLTSVGGGSTHRFALLWVPPADTVAEASLTQTGPAVWTFTPAVGSDSWGSYRIELIVDEGLPTESRQIREFSIRTGNAGLYIPSANTIADPRSTIGDMGAARIDASEQNEAFGPFSAGSAFGWWRALEEIALAVDGAGGGGLLYDMPIDPASVGTPVFIRDETDSPLGPASTATATVVDLQAAPAHVAKALRLELTGGADAGGWIFPVNCGPLPDEGFVVEVWFSGIDAGNKGGFLMPLADFDTTPGTVEGLGALIFSQLYTMMPEVLMASTVYARAVVGPSITGWPTSPVQVFANRGPYVQRVEVRRAQGTTPATWQFKQTLEGPDGSYVVSASQSGVTSPLPSLDGKTFSSIGIGPWLPVGIAPPAYIDIQRLRVYALGS